MSYSIDLKERVVDFVEKGGSKVEAAKLFSVGKRTIFKWIKKKRERGSLANKRRDSSPRKLQEELLKEYLRKHPDDYLREIAVVFKVTPEAVFYACKRWKLTYKKKRYSTKKETRNYEKSFKKK
jgi:transposase